MQYLGLPFSFSERNSTCFNRQRDFEQFYIPNFVGTDTWIFLPFYFTLTVTSHIDRFIKTWTKGFGLDVRTKSCYSNRGWTNGMQNGMSLKIMW